MSAGEKQLDIEAAKDLLRGYNHRVAVTYRRLTAMETARDGLCKYLNTLGMSYGEIAAFIGETKPTVYRRLQRRGLIKENR